MCARLAFRSGSTRALLNVLACRSRGASPSVDVVNKVRIVVPYCSDDSLSEALRELTGVLQEKTGEGAYGFLGGSQGYGCNYEDDVFLMHPFCWCERPECPWCAGCQCATDSANCAWCRGEWFGQEKGGLPGEGAPHFWHKPSGFRVWWYKYIGRGMEVYNHAEGDPVAIVRAAIEHALTIDSAVQTLNLTGLHD